MTPTPTALLLALSLLLGSGGCAPADPSAERAGRVDVPTPASVDLAALTDRLEPRAGRAGVLLHFWATWWGPCIHEMPELVELRDVCEEHGVELLPVSLDAALPRGPVQSPAGVEAFLEERGWDLPGVVFEGDFGGLSERFGVRGTPTTIAFDRTGKRAGRFVGPPGLAAYRELVERLAAD